MIPGGNVLTVQDLTEGFRFLSRLPSFLRHPIGVEEARAVLRGRLERREVDFLALVRRNVYERPESPYRQLLGLAGCEYGDLESLVNRDGVEGALQTLFRHGVYLTLDEFKGRRPVVRGSATIMLDPTQFRNHAPPYSSQLREAHGRGDDVSGR